VYPCGQLPPGTLGFGTGSGSAEAAVVSSARAITARDFILQFTCKSLISGGTV
jgi:hypothetical protein